MDIEATLQTAEDQHRQGNLAAAGQSYNAALQADPGNADACYGLGTVFLQQKNYLASCELLEKAVELQPEVPEFRLNFAMTLEHLRRPVEAAESYLKAIYLAPADGEMLLRAGARMLALGRERVLQKLLQQEDVSSPQLDVLKAQTESALGNWAGATRILQASVKLNPASKDIWRQLSITAASLRDYKTAIQAYRKYLSMSTDNSNDLLAFADLLLMAREIEEANRVIAQAQQQLPDTAHSRLLQAKCARIAGDYSAARKHILCALEMAPELGEAWQMRLETEPDSSRLALATNCAKIASRTTISPRDKIMLQLTAGRAFELCEDYEKAFSCFQAGKEFQKQQLIAKNSAYDPHATETTIDRILQLFSSPVSRGPQVQAHQPQPIFILGMPRSGTTLVERIIGEHEGVVTAGENEAIEFIAAQYYWDLEQGKQSGPLQLAETHWQQMREDYWFRSNRQPTLVTDKMPHNFRHVGLILGIFPASPIIYLRRDPRDVCLSIYSRMFPEGHRYACDLKWLAHFTLQSNRIMDHWQKILPGKVLQVNYEELVENPELQSQRIAEFCGLEWNPDCLNFHNRQVSSFTFSEIQVRQPINRDGIDRWKSYEFALGPLLETLHHSPGHFLDP